MLGCEQQLPFPLEVEERLLPKPVAREEKRACCRVPDGQCEHPLELLDRTVPIALVHVHYDFRVRARAEAMSLRDELLPELLEVVDLTVEHGPDSILLPALWLVTRHEVDHP